MAPTGQQRRGPQPRSMLNNSQQAAEAAKLKFGVFLKCVLDF